MDFTSGGTNGRILNDDLYDIPDGTLKEVNTKLEVATKFYELGWSVRKSSWTDYKVETERGEFGIEGENEILFNGILDESKLDVLGNLLGSIGLKYSLELYNQDKKLKATISNK